MLTLMLLRFLTRVLEQPQRPLALPFSSRVNGEVRHAQMACFGLSSEDRVERKRQDEDFCRALNADDVN